MIDLLCNQPHLRLSDEFLKMVLWTMKECGTPNVPTFARLKASQAAFLEASNIKTEAHLSTFGNRFFQNNPATLFAMVS